VGDLALMAGDPFINVTPDLIAGQYNIVPVDGTLPIDRLAQFNAWKAMLSTMYSTPAGQMMLQGFDMVKLFGWMFSIGGLKNVNQFKAQVMQPGQAPAPGMVPITAGQSGALPPEMLAQMGGGTPPQPNGGMSVNGAGAGGY